MSTFQHEFYEITVPPDGVVVLPEKFRGGTVKVLSPEEEKMLSIIQGDYEFRHPKTLDQILREQNSKPIRSIDELIPAEPAWDSEEEFVEFLIAIGEDPENYR